MEATPRTSAEPDDTYSDQPATREWLQEVHKGRSAMTKIKREAGYTIRLLHCSVHIKIDSRRASLMDDDAKRMLPSQQKHQDGYVDIPERFIVYLRPKEFDTDTEEERLLNKSMFEEASAHRLGPYIKEILLEGGDYDRDLANVIENEASLDAFDNKTSQAELIGLRKTLTRF
ncbi:MAG: hypothetical protein ASARMPRED_005052 [Alectoria sarmentosa]|nr:MAG: hypothetical protein ASARMPRED_005052 [Alectoria sarmentosa]